METFLFQSCYLVTDYKDTLKKCEQDPENYRATVYLNNFDLPQGSTMYVIYIPHSNSKLFEVVCYDYINMKYSSME